jgi:uncharacterized protein
MELEGVVTNITAFGAFVDVGVHQDGLVHISQLADRFVKDPHEIVKVGDRIQVRVLDIDLERRRIALSARRDATVPTAGERQPARPAPGNARKPPPHAGRGAGSAPAATFTNNPFASLLGKTDTKSPRR